MKKFPFVAVVAVSVLGATALGTTAKAQSPAAPAPTAPAVMPDHMTPRAGFVATQTADQWLASQLIGMDVYGAADENLGDVNDVLFDRRGNVVAAVIGVGGFLGMGEKQVAVPMAMVEVVRSNNADKLVLRKTRDELKAAPEFHKLNAAPATTGSVTPRPATPAR